MAGDFDPDSMPAWLATRLATRRTSDDVVAGVNDDDCTVLKCQRGLLVATTDYLNARPIAVELGIGGGGTLGRLAVAANLSDLCGSGATPLALMMAVMMPRPGDSQHFRLLMEGVRAEARRWRVPVTGGDTKLGDSLAIAGVAIGFAPTRRHLFLKYAAHAGDLLWVSGPIGSCSAAVVGLKDGGMSAGWQARAKRTLTVPQLPLKLSASVSAMKAGRGGTDISDGLGTDLEQMCRASGVGAVVWADAVPITRDTASVAKRTGLPGWAFAFGIGGDFQFLVTTGNRSLRRLRDLGMHLIGEITASPELVLRLPDGRERALPIAGHRDARNLSFADEVHHLVYEAANGS